MYRHIEIYINEEYLFYIMTLWLYGTTMYWHVGQLVIISERFTQVKNRLVSISTYFSRL